MNKFFLGFGLLVAFTISCKSRTSSLLDSGSATEETYTLAVAEPLHGDILKFYKALKSEVSLSNEVMNVLPRIIKDIEVTQSFTQEREVRMGNRGDLVKIKDTFRAIRFGKTIFVFNCTSGKCKIFDSINAAYLASKPVIERAKNAIYAKFYELDNLKRLNQSLDTIDFVARMVPGVHGLDQAINAPKLSDKVMGIVSATGDFASFGLASKLNAVKKVAGSTVLATSSLRIMHAAKKSYDGEADAGTGIDAALASIEAVLASVTFVKIKIGRTGRGVINSIEEADRLSPTLKRSSDDILRNGLSESELVALGIKKSSTVIAESSIKALKGKTFVNLRKQFPNLKEEVIVGIEETGHAFLIVKGKQVHAGLLRKIKVKTGVNSLSKPGVFVRLKGLDKSTVDQIAEGIESSNPGRSLSCAQGACSILKEHGNVLVGKGGMFENGRPSTVLQNILDGKLTISQGVRKGELVDFDVLVSRPQKMENFVNQITALETGLGMYVASALTGNFVLVNIVIEPFKEDLVNALVYLLY